MLKTMRPLRLLCLLGIASAAFAADADLQPFDGSSMRAIEERYAAGPFLVAIWATDCAPCRREFRLIASHALRYPEFPFVLIATDNIGNRESVLSILAEYGLDTGDVWAFADPNVERLRFSIDPEWFGEVPRSYYYSEDGERRGFSGPLDEKLLKQWFSGHPAARPDAAEAGSD